MDLHDCNNQREGSEVEDEWTDGGREGMKLSYTKRTLSSIQTQKLGLFIGLLPNRFKLTLNTLIWGLLTLIS